MNIIYIEWRMWIFIITKQINYELFIVDYLNIHFIFFQNQNIYITVFYKIYSIVMFPDNKGS